MTRIAKSVLVRHKITPPGLPAAAISRPRLNKMYADLLDEHEALAVFAAAGSGKTVQAQLFALEEKWPVAWLTLDAADHSTSRMLSYLAAALDRHVPTASKALENVFELTTVTEEAAAVLAETMQNRRLLVVIDHCEAIANAAESCSALETFLDYLPGGVRTMLLSRSELQFSLGRLLLHGRVGRILDEDLALTLDEARELVEARDEDPSNLRERWEAARGWVAAVAFGGPHRTGGHDEARDFPSYLATEVMGGLTPEERRFLLDTSILDAVSQRGATALCGPASRSVWRSVGMRHLPATTSTDRVIVYHPCLRGYLRDQLELEDPARMELLKGRYAELLLDQHQYEEAVELLLSLGRRDDAADAAIHACQTVTDRGDWETQLRWAEEFGHELVYERPLLLGSYLKALRGARRLPEARALARNLRSSGLLPDVLAADPDVIVHVAWAFMPLPSESLSFLDEYDTERRAAGVRYMLEVTSANDPVMPPRGVPLTDTDRLISWALMIQGRLDDLVAMLPSGEEWPPRTPYSTPHPLMGLLWRGELGRVRELFDQVPGSTKVRDNGDLWLNLEAWMLLAEGDPAGALDAAERAVVLSRRTGFGFEPVFEIVQGLALVALGRPLDAISVLQEALDESTRSGLVAYQEWAHAVLGRALLALDDDVAARDHLRAAVAGMRRAQRLLMLPLAAVCLSEAEWRTGNHELADEAAGVAYQSSLQMGAFRSLQVALLEFPGVYRRQLQRDPDAEWRRIGTVAPASIAVKRNEFDGATIAVDVHPFGRNPDIRIAGEPAHVRRLKVLELVSYLAARPGGAQRESVQAHLFPESDRRKGSNHFRQVVHQLHKVTGVTLQRLPNSFISWSDGFSVDATDLQFERALVQARALTGEERLSRLLGALDLVDGPYLAASDLEWVCDRRFEFEVLQEEAELEAARLAVELQHYDVARRCAEALLARNPYSEAAYRALIKTEQAMGSEAAVLAVYRRSVAALKEVGLSPDQNMARLLQRN